MATATKAPPKVKGKGPGKYRVLRGVHCDGQRMCGGVNCDAKCYKNERAKHIEEDMKRPEAERRGCCFPDGPDHLVIYGAKDPETGEFKAGSNAGCTVDSKKDLSLLNTSKDKKFMWIGAGKYTPGSRPASYLDKMSLEELLQEAADRDIPLDDEVEWTKDEVLAEIRMQQANA